jgi:hypothetical protein
MGIFGTVKDAKVIGGGVYFLPGRYRVKVLVTKTIQSAQGKGVFAIHECEILTSTEPSRPPGSKASQVIPMSTGVMGPVNVRRFANALFELPAEATVEELEAKGSEMIGRGVNCEQICELIYDEKEALFNGIELNLEVVQVITKEKKQPFNRHDWSAVA